MSGRPMKCSLRSLSFWVATPVAQLFRWQMRSICSQRDHRAGAEAEGFRTEDRSLDDVEAGLQAAVGLHPHASAQAVGSQHLLRFERPSSHGEPAYLTEASGWHQCRRRSRKW